jgi:integrase
MAGKLTTRSAASFAKRKGRYLDGDGLFLRVLDPGHRVYWVYRFRLNGRDRETSVGAYPAMSLADARAKHKRLVADVAAKIDPVADKHAAKTGRFAAVGVNGHATEFPSGATPTFGQCADQYVATKEGEWRSAKHRTQWRSALMTYAEPIWPKPVDQVTTNDVLAVLEPIWNRVPATASRIRARIEAVLTSAKVKGWINRSQHNPAVWKGWLDGSGLSKPKTPDEDDHHPAMPYANLPEFMAKLSASDNRAASALEFTVLTAARSGETLGMTWDEVSFDKAVWTIPGSRMKKGRLHTVPLCDAALAILSAQEAERALNPRIANNPHVFPGARPRQRLSHTSLAVLLRKLGVLETVHGFRTSFRTWCSEVQHVEFEVAELCLSHQIGGAVSRSYNRTTMLDRRRPVMSAWADYVTGKTTDNVIPLRAARS